MSVVLLEIDWQNWILALSHDPCAAMRGREVRRFASSLGLPVVITRYLSPDSEDPRGDANSPEAAFAIGFEPRQEPVITKHDRNIFDVARTDEVLHELGADRLVITGLVTGHGVRLAAESALQRGYKVTVVSNACGDLSIEEHVRALDEIRASGADVRAAEELTSTMATEGREQPELIGIAEAAELTGLSRDTLRWYEREGLIPRVSRGRNGYRSYDARTVRNIQLLVRLRRTGMPVARMRRYIELAGQGEQTHSQRLALLREHRGAVQKQMDQLAEDLAVLDHKISGYQDPAGAPDNTNSTDNNTDEQGE